MDPTRADKIISALAVKGVNKPCPRCGYAQFGVVAETMVQIQPTSGEIIFGGPVIPVAILGCNNCGFLTQHALGLLGLSPQGQPAEVAHAG